MDRILVIEDNPADAEIIRIYLDEAGFKHRFFHSPSLQDGVNIINEHEIDLVLLDLSINDSVGFSTLKNYLREAPHVPVIILTGNKNEIVGMQSVKAGAQDFLVKGYFDHRRLVNSIRYSLQRFKKQSKLQAAAEKLTINSKRVQDAQQMANFGNWEMDIVNNAMKWSDETYRIFGFQPNSLSPTLSDYMEFVHVADREQVESFFEEVIKSGEVTRVEHRIVINNRTLKYLMVQAQVKYDELTNKILLIGSLQDITYQKREGQTTEPDAAPSDSISDLSTNQFTRLSYNIRTPLSSIVNLLYLLEKSTMSNQQKELISGLKTSVDDLSILLNNLLNYSLSVSQDLRLQEYNFALQPLLDNIVAVGKFKAGQAGFKLVSRQADQLPAYVVADESKLQQILLNLLELAIIYSQPGRQAITLSTNAVEIGGQAQLQFKVAYKGNTFRMPFPPPDSLPNAGGVLWRQASRQDTDQPQLGSYIAGKLTAVLNGELQLTSPKPNEHHILCRIPIQEYHPEPGFEGDDQLKRPVHILLVEDHVLNQIATKKLLLSWSSQVQVTTADNGADALEKFTKGSFDLVLMDLQLPEISGLETTRRIRQSSQVPIIALTASASKQEAERCLRAGMNSYLAKPYQPDDLKNKILELLVEK